MEKVVVLLIRNKHEGFKDFENALSWLWNRGLYEVKDLHNGHGAWSLTGVLGDMTTRGHQTKSSGDLHLQLLVKFVNNLQGANDQKLQHSKGWSWEGIQQQQRGWALPTQSWNKIIAKPLCNLIKVNSRWDTEGSVCQWICQFKNLWSGWTHPKARLTIWRVLVHTFYCNKRGRTWTVSNSDFPF